MIKKKNNINLIRLFDGTQVRCLVGNNSQTCQSHNFAPGPKINYFMMKHTTLLSMAKRLPRLLQSYTAAQYRTGIIERERERAKKVCEGAPFVLLRAGVSVGVVISAMYSCNRPIDFRNSDAVSIMASSSSSSHSFRVQTYDSNWAYWYKWRINQTCQWPFIL